MNAAAVALAILAAQASAAEMENYRHLPSSAFCEQQRKSANTHFNSLQSRLKLVAGERGEVWPAGLWFPGAPKKFAAYPAGGWYAVRLEKALSEADSYARFWNAMSWAVWPNVRFEERRSWKQEAINALGLWAFEHAWSVPAIPWEHIRAE